MFLAVVQFSSDSVRASYCPAPQLDSAFSGSDYVFVALLTEAKIEKDFSASGVLTVQDVLKGTPPTSIPFTTQVENGINCGMELSLLKPYLVFLKDGQVGISITSGTRLIVGESELLEWIRKKMFGQKVT